MQQEGDSGVTFGLERTWRRRSEKVRRIAWRALSRDKGKAAQKSEIPHSGFFTKLSSNDRKINSPFATS